MKRTVLAGVVIGLVLAAAAPAVGQDIRDRLVFNGVNADGVIASGVVVDDYPADFFSVATSWTEPCTGANGEAGVIRTLANLSIPEPFVDVPQLLQGVAASGEGIQSLYIVNGCKNKATIKERKASATLSGIRTSQLENFGNSTFTGTGIGTLTVGKITVEVAIDFERRPLQ
jgi:hypothetical protein